MDMDDFRLRVLHKLNRPLSEAKDLARIASLSRSSMLELKTSAGLEPSLQQAPHVEKDKELLRALLEFSISPNKPKQWLQELFDSLKVGKTPSDCFQLLIDLEVLKPETNPCVLRFEEPLLFSPQILAEVPRLMQLSESHDPDAKVRVDLSSQPVLTIDAVTATEIDDAVGLDVDEQGREWIHVHVADVSRLIEAKSPLERLNFLLVWFCRLLVHLPLKICFSTCCFSVFARDALSHVASWRFKCLIATAGKAELCADICSKTE
jgi:hypothetical protein